MPKQEELYEGLPKAQAKIYRKEAIKNWGKEVIENSESHLIKMSKTNFDSLKNEFLKIINQISSNSNQNPQTDFIQNLISKHYQYISQFWGSKPSAEAYAGLGELYVSDERYTMKNGKTNPEFAKFMKEAMAYYAKNNL